MLTSGTDVLSATCQCQQTSMEPLSSTAHTALRRFVYIIRLLVVTSYTTGMPTNVFEAAGTSFALTTVSCMTVRPLVSVVVMTERGMVPTKEVAIVTMI